MAKNPHLAWHNKRTPSVKEMNALSKFEKQYRSVSAEEVDTDHYACPKCGQFMKLEKANYENQNDIHFLICSKCDIRAKLRREKNGKMVLISTPADAKTRALRKEAHYYLDIINKYQIFATKSQTYQWLTEQVFTFGVGIRHIGEYDRYNCQKAIEVLIKCLQNNIRKMPNGFRYYKGDQGKNYSMELGYTGIERENN